jgi:hypothetical protein
LRLPALALSSMMLHLRRLQRCVLRAANRLAHRLGHVLVWACGSDEGVLRSVGRVFHMHRIIGVHNLVLLY